MDRRGPFALVLTWDALNLSHQAHPDAVLETLGKIPKDGAVFALSRVAREVERRGEINATTQRHLVDFALVPSRLRNRVRRKVGEGYIFAPRESIVRLTRLALAHCPPGSSDLTEEQRDQLFQQLLLVNEFLVGGRWLEEDPDLERRAKIARLTVFLGAAMAGSTGPEAIDDMSWILAALCSKHLSNTKKLDKKLIERVGRGMRDLHAITVLLLSQFEASEGELYDVRPVPSPVPERGTIIDAATLVEALSCDNPKPLDFLAVESPPTAEFEQIRWRPIFRSGKWMVCWDIHALRRLASLNFPRIIQSLAPTLFGDADDVWNAAVEAAITDMLRLYSEAVARPSSSMLAPPETGESKKTADWFVGSGKDLFVLEWKNLQLPPRTFGTSDPEQYEAWLRESLVEDRGFCQVYDTLARAARSTRTAKEIGGLGDYERVWPILLIPFNIPMDALLQGTLNQAVEPWVKRVAPSIPHLRPPVILHFQEFMSLLATRGDLGFLLEAWLARGFEPPPLFRTHLRDVLGAVPSLKEISQHAAPALDDMRELAASLKGLEPQSTKPE